MNFHGWLVRDRKAELPSLLFPIDETMHRQSRFSTLSGGRLGSNAEEGRD